MKKLLIGILTPIVIIVGGVTVLYFLATDSSSPSYQTNNKTNEEVINEVIYDGFKNTKTNKAIKMELTQDSLNQIIYNTTANIDNDVKQYLRGVEIKIEGKTYHVYVYAQYSFAKTKVDLQCEFAEDDDNFYLNITNIKMGSLSGLDNIIFKFLKDDTLNSAFSSSGLHFVSDLANKRIKYSKADLKNDLIKSVSDSSLASSILTNAFDNNLIDLDFNGAPSGTFNLEPLNFNENFCSKENMLAETDLNLDSNRDKLETLIKSNIVDDDSTHRATTFTYLLTGYDSLNDENKSYIDTLDLSSIGITDNDAYLGYEPTDPDLTSKINGSASITTGVDVLITEQDINDYIKCQNFLGYSSLIKTDDNNIIYITLDNFYTNILNVNNSNQMDMVIGVNMNGYETSVILENSLTEKTKYGFKLKNDNIYLGSATLNDDLKSTLYGIIKSSLTENTLMSFDGEGTFTISFESYLSDYIQLLNKSPIPLEFTLDTALIGTSLSDRNAGIKLSGSLTTSA